MGKYIHYGTYDYMVRYVLNNMVNYNGKTYFLDIPQDDVNYGTGVIGEIPGESKYWKRIVPVQDEVTIKLKNKEVDIITSCIRMALSEGLYGLDNDGIEHKDEDMFMILLKLGVPRQKAEDMIKYC
jgi:hypothetical protein